MRHSPLAVHIVLLLGLLVPVLYAQFQPWPIQGLISLLVLVFGLLVSGPLLILYGLLVGFFSRLKERMFLAVIALSIGGGWTAYILYGILTA